MMENLELQSLNAVKDQIEAKLNSIAPEDWFKYSYGTTRDRIGYTKAMIYYTIYFDCSFTMAGYRVMLGLVAPHHNMKIGIISSFARKLW